jgi:hypothetical protein
MDLQIGIASVLWVVLGVLFSGVVTLSNSVGDS